MNVAAPEEAIRNLEVALLDSVVNERDLKRREDTWICNLGTLFVGANTRNEVLSNNRVNYGRGRGN
jgi:hypothetical protein